MQLGLSTTRAKPQGGKEEGGSACTHQPHVSRKTRTTTREMACQATKGMFNLIIQLSILLGYAGHCLKAPNVQHAARALKP